MERNRLEWARICMKAMQISMVVLGDKLDKSGLPLFWHCLSVAGRFKDWQLKTTALLHDCIEDGHNLEPYVLQRLGVPRWLIDEDGYDVTIKKLIHMGIDDEDVLAALEALTKRKKETYSAYLTRVKANPEARLVKLADIEDNMAAERLSYLTDSKAVKICHKYWGAIRYLRDKDADAQVETGTWTVFLEKEMDYIKKGW